MPPSLAIDDLADEADLWSERSGPASEAARLHLFDRHAGFARAIARRHHRTRTHGDLELADIRQMAAAGLLEAIDRFDRGRGVAFRAFAAHRIAGSIATGIAQTTELRRQYSARGRLRRERIRSLAVPTPAEPSPREAVDALAEIAVGLALGFMLEALDEGEAHPAQPATGYDSAAWRQLVGRLEAELARLPPRERSILRHHYLDGLGFDGLSAILGIGKSRVSQLHRAALATLRKRLGGHGHFSIER